jgi:hypothetical protein
MRNRTARCSLLLLAVLSCTAVAQHSTVRYLQARDAFSFFPAGTFDRARPHLDTFDIRWYGGALLALHEPPLLGARPGQRTAVLRFLWLRSFHPEVAVRFEAAPDRCRVVTTVLRRRPEPAIVGRSGTIPIDFVFGGVARRDSTDLPMQTCESLLHRLDEAGFWSAPVTKEVNGADGAEWVIEGIDGGRYHVISRWSPSESRDKPVRTAGLTFLLLGRAAPDPHEIY